MKNLVIIIFLFLSVNLSLAQWKIAEGCTFDKLISIKTKCNMDITVIYESKRVEEMEFSNSLAKRTITKQTLHRFNKTNQTITDSLVSIVYETYVNSIISIGFNTNLGQNDTVHFRIQKPDIHVNLSSVVRHYEVKSPPITSAKKRGEKRDTIMLDYDPDKNMTGGLYLAVSAMPLNFGYRQLLVRQTNFNNYEMLDRRRYNESYLFSLLNFSGKVGWRIAPSHILYGEYGYFEQGFRTFGHSINWENGFPESSTSKRWIDQKMNNHVLGLSYNYTYNDDAYWSFTADMGLYGRFGGTNFLDKSIDSELFRKCRMGMKIGAGVSYSSSYWYNIKLMPTLLWDFSPIDRGIIRSRLYNMGLTVEIGFNPFRFRNYN